MGDNQLAILEQQLDHDRKMRTIDRLHDLIAQGAKGLSILNAGAVVAMLAFIQALLPSANVYASFKPYAVTGLSCFLVGAFLASIIFFFHDKLINHAFSDTGNQGFWHRVVWGLLKASAAFALFGGITVTIGIYRLT